ncbi:hypothetical protein SO802_033802 [Lithocarpus litseifolius]|uniref:Uncharacterized protein n=1 Tax=Lithocarpus litseifolius TaxID=425828 RepID=A0AAW2BGT3_9ROSI
MISLATNLCIKVGFSSCYCEVLGSPKIICSGLKLLNSVPTIEESFAILGYDPGRKSVAVSCDPRHRESLSDALGLTTSITSSMIEGHIVTLRAIVSRFIDKRTYGVTNNMQKSFGLALCFVGEFLLYFGRHGFVNVQAISVVSQIKDGDNLVSLILVETLLGLDAVFHGGNISKLPGESLYFVDMANGATRYDCQAYNWQFQHEQGMPSGKRRRPFTPVDTNPTFIRNKLLGLEVADRVDQSFVKVHFHKMTTEYFNWLVNKIADKEAEMVAIRKQFLRDNRERHDEDNYELKRRDKNDEVLNTEEINDQQKEKRLKTK